MDWSISLSSQANGFLSKNHLSADFTIDLIRKAIWKIAEKRTVAIDVKRLTGRWADCFRIRKGKVRIIFSLNLDEQRALIEIIDYRGSAYR